MSALWMLAWCFPWSFMWPLVIMLIKCKAWTAVPLISKSGRVTSAFYKWLSSLVATLGLCPPFLYVLALPSRELLSQMVWAESCLCGYPLIGLVWPDLANLIGESLFHCTIYFGFILWVSYLMVCTASVECKCAQLKLIGGAVSPYERESDREGVCLCVCFLWESDYCLQETW